MVKGQGSGQQRGTSLVDSNSGYTAVPTGATGLQRWHVSVVATGLLCSVILVQPFSGAQALIKSGCRFVNQIRLIKDLPYKFSIWICTSSASPPSSSCSPLCIAFS